MKGDEPVSITLKRRKWIDSEASFFLYLTKSVLMVLK